jgi:predicted ABC-type sugar transport system permease subunit
MSPPEGKNPEHRSNNAMLCFCLGAGLAIAAYVLGVGAVIGAAFSGGDPAIIVGSMLGAVGLVLMGIAGFVMMIIGGVWMILRVIADQTGDRSEKRYRDVER